MSVNIQEKIGRPASCVLACGEVYDGILEGVDGSFNVLLSSCRERTIALQCGDGEQSVIWLANAAMVFYNDAVKTRRGTPIAVRKESGTVCDPNARVCDVFKDEQHVFAEVYQVARAVAHGHGEWSDVPRCVREGVLLALARPQSTTLPASSPLAVPLPSEKSSYPFLKRKGEPQRRKSNGEYYPHYDGPHPSRHDGGRSRPPPPAAAGEERESWCSGKPISGSSASSPAAEAALYRASHLASSPISPPPPHLSTSSSSFSYFPPPPPPPPPPASSSSPFPIPPYLTEAMIERNINSFNDAVWVREQAVRSYAQFHNSVEILTTSMGSHLNALWHSAIPLSPIHLQHIRRSLKLRMQDIIPDGVLLPETTKKDIIVLESLLHRLASGVQQLREDSVTFASFFLTEEEKLAMGANPVYLRRRQSGGGGGSSSRSPKVEGRRRRKEGGEGRGGKNSSSSPPSRRSTHRDAVEERGSGRQRGSPHGEHRGAPPSPFHSHHSPSSAHLDSSFPSSQDTRYNWRGRSNPHVGEEEGRGLPHGCHHRASLLKGGSPSRHYPPFSTPGRGEMTEEEVEGPPYLQSSSSSTSTSRSTTTTSTTSCSRSLSDHSSNRRQHSHRRDMSSSSSSLPLRRNGKHRAKDFRYQRDEEMEGGEERIGGEHQREYKRKAKKDVDTRADKGPFFHRYTDCRPSPQPPTQGKMKKTEKNQLKKGKSSETRLRRCTEGKRQEGDGERRRKKVVQDGPSTPGAEAAHRSPAGQRRTSTPPLPDTEAEELELAEDMRREFFKRLGNKKGV